LTVDKIDEHQQVKKKVPEEKKNSREILEKSRL